MERLTIDEIIAHCKRRVRREEALNGRDFFETELMGHYHMQEYWEHRQVAEYLEELKEYRKAEEQGLLLRLPCNAASAVTMYRVVDCGTWMDTCETDCYSCKKDCPYEGREDERVFKIVPWKMESVSTIVLAMEQLGKTVFLTKAEAEAALAEKGGVE